MVAAALDPLLTNTVFTAGQTGLRSDAAATKPPTEGRWPEQSGSVLWCAPYDEVQENYPSLPQAHRQGQDNDCACVDLTVTITSGRITEVNFEGLSLPATFAPLGRQEDAEAAKHLLGASAQSVTPELTRLLSTLLDRPKASSGQRRSLSSRTARHTS